MSVVAWLIVAVVVIVVALVAFVVIRRRSRRGGVIATPSRKGTPGATGRTTGDPKP
ncbi:MAG TPA: hypothetical protein VHT75_07745 [Acidimicrobiales bacterium]|jgi:septation ring formation regulator EzrA|nr:hypothetical protein [Acidimicrobiales bacterium]